MDLTEIEYADCEHIGFITKQATNNRSWGRVTVDVDTLRSLLVISNKYGYLIAGTQTEAPQLEGIKNVVTPSQVQHLALSCDELHLAVLLDDGVLFYRICDLLYGTDVEPHKEIENATLALDWSPNDPQSLLMLAEEEDGLAIFLYNVSSGASTQIDVVKGTVDVSWCPSKDKKEFACLSDDGIHIFSLVEEEWEISSDPISIDFPEEHENPRPLSFRWLDDFLFLVGFSAILDDEPTIVCILLSGTSFEDMTRQFCLLEYAPDAPYTPYLYAQAYIPQWKVIVFTTNVSETMSIIGYNDTDEVWELWEIEPTAEIENGEYCLGMAFDLTSTIQVPDRSGENPYPPSPVLIFCTTDGKLNPTDFVNKNITGSVPFMVTELPPIPAPPAEDEQDNQDPSQEEPENPEKPVVEPPKPTIVVEAPLVIKQPPTFQQPAFVMPKFETLDNDNPLRQAQKRTAIKSEFDMPKEDKGGVFNIVAPAAAPKPVIQPMTFVSPTQPPAEKKPPQVEAPQPQQPSKQPSINNQVEDEFPTENYKKQIQQIFSEFGQILVELNQNFGSTPDISHLEAGFNEFQSLSSQYAEKVDELKGKIDDGANCGVNMISDIWTEHSRSNHASRIIEDNSKEMQHLNPEAEDLRKGIRESSIEVQQSIGQLERDVRMISTSLSGALKNPQNKSKVLPMDSFFRTIKNNEYTVQKTQRHLAHLRERIMRVNIALDAKTTLPRGPRLVSKKQNSNAVPHPAMKNLRQIIHARVQDSCLTDVNTTERIKRAKPQFRSPMTPYGIQTPTKTPLIFQSESRSSQSQKKYSEFSETPSIHTTKSLTSSFSQTPSEAIPKIFIESDSPLASKLEKNITGPPSEPVAPAAPAATPKVEFKIPAAFTTAPKPTIDFSNPLGKPTPAIEVKAPSVEIKAPPPAQTKAPPSEPKAPTSFFDTQRPLTGSDSKPKFGDSPSSGLPKFSFESPSPPPKTTPLAASLDSSLMEPSLTAKKTPTKFESGTFNFNLNDPAPPASKDKEKPAPVAAPATTTTPATAPAPAATKFPAFSFESGADSTAPTPSGFSFGTLSSSGSDKPKPEKATAEKPAATGFSFGTLSSSGSTTTGGLGSSFSSLKSSGEKEPSQPSKTSSLSSIPSVRKEPTNEKEENADEDKGEGPKSSSSTKNIEKSTEQKPASSTFSFSGFGDTLTKKTDGGSDKVKPNSMFSFSLENDDDSSPLSFSKSLSKSGTTPSPFSFEPPSSGNLFPIAKLDDKKEDKKEEKKDEDKKEEDKKEKKDSSFSLGAINFGSLPKPKEDPPKETAKEPAVDATTQSKGFKLPGSTASGIKANADKPKGLSGLGHGLGLNQESSFSFGTALFDSLPDPEPTKEEEKPKEDKEEKPKDTLSWAPPTATQSPTPATVVESAAPVFDAGSLSFNLPSMTEPAAPAPTAQPEIVITPEAPVPEVSPQPPATLPIPTTPETPKNEPTTPGSFSIPKFSGFGNGTPLWGSPTTPQPSTAPATASTPATPSFSSPGFGIGNLGGLGILSGSQTPAQSSGFKVDDKAFAAFNSSLSGQSIVAPVTPISGFSAAPKSGFAAAGTSVGFAAATGPGFGAATSESPSSGGFGFSTPSGSSSFGFGQGSTPSVFGGTPSIASGFGTTTASTPSGFGGFGSAPSTGFGAIPSSFGNSTNSSTTPSAFGGGAAPAWPSASPSTSFAPTTSGFSFGNPSGGQQQTSVFPGPSTPGGFGSAPSTGFGSAPSTGFGSAPSTGFGFGSPSTPSTGFGAPSSGFGFGTGTTTSSPAINPSAGGDMWKARK